MDAPLSSILPSLLSPQERGIRRAVVRDETCADPDNLLAAFVGVVCDKAIFRSMGLYPPEPKRDAVMEAALARQLLNGFAGSDVDTPRSSMAATPVGRVPTSETGACDADQQHPHLLIPVPGLLPMTMLQQQPSQDTEEGSMGLDSAGNEPGGRCSAEQGGPPGTPTLPQSGGVRALGCVRPLTAAALVAARERDAYASSASLSSRGSSLGSPSPRGAGGASVAGSGSGGAIRPTNSGEAPSDALTRYRTAASLWEMDMDEVEVIRKIGEGSFGEVLLGNLRGTKVCAIGRGCAYGTLGGREDGVCVHVGTCCRVFSGYGLAGRALPSEIADW